MPNSAYFVSGRVTDSEAMPNFGYHIAPRESANALRHERVYIESAPYPDMPSPRAPQSEPISIVAVVLATADMRCLSRA